MSLSAAELADRLEHDSAPAVAEWVRWARLRGRGEELRLLAPFVAAGLVVEDAGRYALAREGQATVREMAA